MGLVNAIRQGEALRLSKAVKMGKTERLRVLMSQEDEVRLV